MKLREILMAEQPAAEQPGTTSGSPQSTPETTPSADVEAPQAETPESEDDVAAGGEPSPVDWAGLSVEEDEESDAAAPGTPTTPPAQPAATPPASVSTPAAQPATPPAAQPAAQPQAKPVEQPPAQPAKTQEQIEQEARAAAEKFEQDLVQYYALPADLAKKFETEPEAVLPQLAAKVHMAVVNEVTARMNVQLPQYIAHFGTQQRKEQEAHDAFYTRWPGLTDYKEQVLKTGAMFRQLNPNATAQEALENVGKMVYAALGMPVPDAAPQSGQPGQPASGQPAQPAPTGAPRVPFVPATPGGAGRQPGPAPGNVFENMAEEFIQEDR